MNLRASHFGYAYQDLITAFALVDLVLGTAASVTVDTKGFPDDRFDDLTVLYRDGRRIRLQIKHTTLRRALSKGSFSQDRRSLRLDDLFETVLADLDQYPQTMFRVVVRDGEPDEGLRTVLKPIGPASDPGDPLPGVSTRRYKFDPEALQAAEPWKSLLVTFDGDQIKLVCERLSIDIEAPAATLDFTNPGPAERALLRRAVDELGAGRVPNANVSPDHVALALTFAATSARARDGHVAREHVLPRVGLVTDFGAVADGHPIEPAVAVNRTGAITESRRQVEAVAQYGGRAVLIGEPGVGKSWLCEQLAQLYNDDGWIVARHHCWLGSSDGDREDRVLADVVIGSLLHQLELIVPEATADLTPRFAANADALGLALGACRGARRHQAVLLIVDGLDHVDRVLAARSGRPASSATELVEQLASIDLPPGVCMLIASQPGQHLVNAAPTTGEFIELPRMSWAEIESLSQKHGIFERIAASEGATDDDRKAVIDLVYERCGGNALYATYLVRLATSPSPADGRQETRSAYEGLLHRLTLVPDSVTDIDGYYEHLLIGMSGDLMYAIGVLALCDFAVSAEELAQIVPTAGPLLKEALAKLAPVLSSQPGLGGLRVHHESFSRHILREIDSEWASEIRARAADWLKERGFFTDARAFRHLPELLALLGRYEELKLLLQPDFVAQSIYFFHPPEALVRVVRVTAHEAQARLDWPTLIACTETRKTIDTYENESLIDSIMEYVGVIVSIVGPTLVVERLLYDGKPTFPARWGLIICEALDKAGVAAPWKEYIDAREIEARRENTSYGTDSDAALERAMQLGALRVRSRRGDEGADLADRVAEHLDLDHMASLEDLVEVFADGLPAGTMERVASVMTDKAKAARVLITLADLAANGAPGLPSSTELARQAVSFASADEILGCLRHGVPAADLVERLRIIDLGAELKTATSRLANATTADYDGVKHWLSLVALARAFDQGLLLGIASQLSGVGFYRGWLRYAVATVGIEDDVAAGHTAAPAASAAVKVALEELRSHAHAFTGEPRACDLYFIHPLIHDVIEESMRVVQPEDLGEVLGHLIAIGDGTTTTSNFGLAESGPFVTNDLLAVLSRVSGQIGAGPIHGMIREIRERRSDTHTEYRITADFELAVARICIAAGSFQEAGECWRRASVLLASYGGHKDPTILEIIDSVHVVADVDIAKGRVCLQKLVDLVYLVRQHTDGKGTAYFVHQWWRTAAVVDPSAAALDGADIILSALGLEDSRVHEAHTQLISSQARIADPVALAALRIAVGGTWRDPSIDVVLLRRLAAELGKSQDVDIVLAIVANFIASTYDDQPLMYANDQPKTVALQDLIDSVVRLGGADFSPRVPRSEPEQASAFSAPSADPLDLMKRLTNAQRPVLEVGRPGAIVAAREYAQRRFRDDAQWGTEAAANAIGWRVLEAVSSDGALAGIELLDEVAREIPSFSDNEVFAAIGQGLSARCDGANDELRTVASYSLVLAYIRIRCGGGWQGFAGAGGVDLWADAHEFDPDLALRTLASAVAEAAGGEAYGVFGVTQGVIAALAATDGDRAVDCWEAAFAILDKRLPGMAERSGHAYRPGIVPDGQHTTDRALATLAVATICYPARVDIRKALLATTLLLVCRPATGQAAIARILGSGLDAGRATWLLDLVRNNLQLGELSDGLAQELVALARSDRLSERVRASDLLGSHGRVVPEPPATGPAPEVRLAFRALMEQDW